ncbi:hypothetical protein C8J57DRAFT_1061935 [Mycena rebaudengoi]|nr:hypothetical protein C8J57DRAFT_1061935 [Mycena rebaudengoi]
MDFQKICTVRSLSPAVAKAFPHTDVVKYIELIGLLKPTPALAHLQPSHQISVPPATLPVNVHEFLKACFSLADETAKLAWEVFRDLAWAFTPSTEEQRASRIKYVRLFLLHGLPLRIGRVFKSSSGLYALCPPTRVCLDPACRQPLLSDPSTLRDRELGEPRDHPISVFTIDFGAVPGYSTSCYCRNCHRRHYPSFYVHDSATTRTYYVSDLISEFIHTAEHFYLAVNLCELFSNMMATAWTSATNCAHIYNTSISNNSLRSSLPTDWQTSFDLDVEDVWNGFFSYALLLDHYERKEPLKVQHNASSQPERLRPALEARNIRMAGTGQEEWNHACEACCYMYQIDEGPWCAFNWIIH